MFKNIIFVRIYSNFFVVQSKITKLLQVLSSFHATFTKKSEIVRNIIGLLIIYKDASLSWYFRRFCRVLFETMVCQQWTKPMYHTSPRNWNTNYTGQSSTGLAVLIDRSSSDDSVDRHFSNYQAPRSNPDRLKSPPWRKGNWAYCSATNEREKIKWQRWDSRL